MDVGCPRCHVEYELDDARVSEEGVTVKCTSCGHVFRVKKKQLVVTLPVRDGDTPSGEGPAADLPPPPPTREWKVRQPSGNLFPCRDLTMLQKWIIEGKVARDDEISHTGETWKRLGNIPELASFFQIVEDAAKARALEALARTTPTAAAPPGATETWKGGRFTEPPPPSPVPPPRASTPRAPPSPAPAPPIAESPAAETLPPEPPPRKRDTLRGPQFSTPPPALTETLKGGRFSQPVVPVKAPEPTDEELRRAVQGGGGGKWLLLVLGGLAVGGGVGWYFGVYEPQQERARAEAHAQEQARLQAEALARATPPVHVAAAAVDAGPEQPDAGPEVDAGAAGPDAGAGEPDAGLDAGVADAGAGDAGVAPEAGVPDAGAKAPAGVGAPIVTEQKRTFDWYVAQGDRQRDRERPEEALDFYAQAEALRPERPEAVAGKGLALLDMANTTGAVVAFQRALQLGPRYGPAIMGLAEAYRLQGDKAKAIEFYQRYIDVLPDGSEAAVARNSIERLKQ